MVGVYQIQCGDRSYIGSSVDIESRISNHFQNLRTNRHDNIDMQLDFNCNKQFSWEILEECLELDLLSIERKWYNLINNKYNKTPPHSIIILKDSQILLFWSKVDIKQLSQCWNWLGAKDKDGYGRISLRLNGNRTTYRSNRLAYYIYNKNNNTDLIVRHTCNNPSCCNPKHLKLGSYSDNKKDITKTGKYKLTWDDVNLLRKYFIKNPQICRHELNSWVIKRFNIVLPINYIIDICMNKKWKDVDYKAPMRYRYYNRDKQGKFIRLYNGAN